MNNKKLIIIAVIVVAVFCAVLSANVNKLNRLPDPTPTPAATESTKAPSKMAPVVAKMFDNDLKQAFGNNYQTELDTEEGVFRVDTWSSDVNAQFITDLKNGNIDITAWNAVVDRVKSVTSSMQSTFDEVCDDEIIVVSSICDPLNHDISYLTVANGVAGYDVVNGIDLLTK